MAVDSINKRSKKTAARILDAAVRQFAERGCDGARIDEIARAAGVNKAAIYYHVGGKAELHARVVDRVLGGMADRVADNVKKAPTGEERIRSLITTLARNVGTNEFFAPMMMREIASGGSALPDSVMLEMVRLFGALFCILDEGASEGQLRSVNPLIAYLMIMGTLAFYFASGPVREKIASLGETELQIALDVPAKQAAEQFADMVVHALKA